ncbi:MAG: NYN domain-containing protein [Dehalococcoidia bacterium]
MLNIFPRREKATATAAAEPERTLPEPSPEALDGAKKPTRRGTRGGRGRRKPAGETVEVAAAEPEAKPAAKSAAAEEPKKAPARRSRAAKPAEAAEEPVAKSEPATEPETKAPRRTAARKTAPAPASAPEGASPDLAALIKVVEAQGKKLEQLVKAQEDLAKKAIPVATGGAISRVGVFVDSANVELAIDRLRTRVDWKKVLNLVAEGRQIVRAIAYSPVHDDPSVSIETQRFAEPFLGKGYKVVTKPLKRFADGTIKANVDIEMACDIIEMLDRLDVVVLVSGDGDFQRLVEVIQGKGVRVEVMAVGSSTASSLRNAADSFIDLQSIIQKVKA